jgi:hypothetical protein
LRILRICENETGEKNLAMWPVERISGILLKHHPRATDMFHLKVLSIYKSNTYLLLIFLGLNIRITFEENPHISYPFTPQRYKKYGN